MHVFAADDEFLNLNSTFVNLENFGVTHQLFDRVITIESIATENLDSISSSLIGGIATE